jgi:hypothetical protein
MMAEKIYSDSHVLPDDAENAGQLQYLYRCKEECIFAVVNDNTVILTPSLEYLKIDETGAEIVKILSEWRSIGSIVLELKKLYFSYRDDMVKDVILFLESLIVLGVIEIREL